MISNVFDQGIFKVLVIFSLSPGSRFTRKELKSKTRMNNVPLDSSLSRAKRSGILKKEANYYSLNFDSSEGKELVKIIGKQHTYMKEIPLDVYFPLVDISYRLSAIRGSEAFLFGSYSKLVYKESSDIDLAILGKIDKKLFEKYIKKLENTYKKNIEIHYFDKQSFYKNKKDPLVREILKNGTKIL